MSRADEKIWGILVNLGAWSDGRPYTELPFDEDAWDTIVDGAYNAGFNTIIICIGGGIDFSSHPELTLKGAWSQERLKKEINRCREKGIKLIPKLNFASPHDIWLGEYSRMISTPIYYKVCKDMINEAYELFEHPEYIHIGMDEEDAKHVATHQWAMYRQGDLFWHDLRFLVDCVKETGAKPWMWSCPLFDHPEEYKKHFAPDEAVLSPWYYNAFRKENWTPITSLQAYIDYYNEEPYASMHLEYVEEDPFLVNVRNVAVPLSKEGYLYAPCASTINRCEHNSSDLVEYFKENVADNQLVGFLTAPWRKIVSEYKADFEESFKKLKEARDKFYK